ncbi:MAG: LysM peptidoglycan-binding domain-containing protein [Lentimicrobiaceae bacterium]|nr:LysM peptidoglycan-binding domain-containing protein [Lentimicrobiaceae bacterium]
MQFLTKKIRLLKTWGCVLAAVCLFPAVGRGQALVPPQEDRPAKAQAITREDSLANVLLEEFFLSKELLFFNKNQKKNSDTAQIQERPELTGDIPYYNEPDSVYIARLNGLSDHFVVKLPYNQKVKNYIDVYVNKRRQQINVMLALSQYYFPIFEQAMERNGVPQELKYLAIIESALNPRAVSKVGASGSWQFMYQTGRMYNLKIDQHVDERFDPEKASDAAARYLKDLYDNFGDWILAIAAYNCGPGNVNRAIRRAQGKTDFWQIYPFLPRETRGYVPAFIGATYIMNYYKEYGFEAPSSIPLLTDTLMVDKDLSLGVVAEKLNIPLQVLRDLNPQYRRDVIPGNTDYYSLRLPVNFTIKFMENEEDIYADTNNRIPPTPLRFPYRVQRGQTLSNIAAKFKVKVSDIMKWNNLRSSTIYPNQILYIYTDDRPVQASSNLKFPPDNTTGNTDKGKVSMTVTKPRDDKPAVKSPSQMQATRTYTHTVRKGETVYSISRRYQGSSVNDIIRTNKLNKKGTIYPGQTLKIVTTQH